MTHRSLNAPGDGDVPVMRINAAVARGFVTSSRVAAGVLILIGVVAWVAWSAGWQSLVQTLPNQPGMKPSAALAAVLAGLALWSSKAAASWARTASIVLSLLVAALGGMTVLEYLTTLDLGIDHLFPDPSSQRIGRAPGRMAELAALGFVLLGTQGALTALERGLWLREACALVVIGLTLAGLSAYSLRLTGGAIDLLTYLPIHTAFVLLIAALGWMASAPGAGLARIATADSLGGAFARRLILPSLLLPVAFTLAFRLLQQQLGASGELALALAAVCTGGTVSFLVLWVARLIDQGERQRRAYSELLDDASTDALTGLANRGAFDAAIQRLLASALARGTPVSLLMLDLDHFKSFNDRFGHPAGDEALRTTGRLLHDLVRTHDVAARYGGEEFALLLDGADEALALEVAGRILARFRAHAWPHRSITVSIGVAAARAGDDVSDWIARADRALYRSKREGRDRATGAQAQDLPTGLSSGA